MTRMVPAVPAVPSTTTGTMRCFNMSRTLSTDQGARAYSGANNPPAVMPKYLKSMNINSNANMKFGTAKPIKPTAVKK